MRHKKHRASLGVTREHRKAMLSNMSASLITHGRIETTLTKAKALRCSRVTPSEARCFL